MMYIEHTTLEDNLQYILKRVPSSGSPSGAEATLRVEAAAAASALPDRGREEAQVNGTANNGLTIVNGICNKSASELINNHHIHWSRRSDPNLISLNTKIVNAQEPSDHLDETSLKLDKFVQNLKRTKSKHLRFNCKTEEQEYEQPSSGRQNNSFRKGNNYPEVYFENKKSKLPNTDYEEEEDFEYVIKQVPKIQRHSLQPDQTYYQHQERLQGNATNHLNYRNNINRPASRTRRPLPEVIPIEIIRSESKETFNGFLKPDPPLPKFRIRRHSLREESPDRQKNFNYHSDSETSIDRESELSSYFASSNNKEDSSMGLDIINKLKQFLNWNSSSNHYSTTQSEGKRKRRSDDWYPSEPEPHQIKYRKVENRFPKYIARAQEDDDVLDFSPSTSTKQQYLLQNKNFSTNAESDMSNRRTTKSSDKPTEFRKSMFSSPQVTQQCIRNTVYADVELSDDDEPISSKGLMAAARTKLSVPKFFNIPSLSTTHERLKPTAHRKPPPPPLIEPRTGNILSTPYSSDWNSGAIRKPTYSEALKQSNGQIGVARSNGHVLGRRPPSNFASDAAEAARVSNGLSQHMTTNPWSLSNCSQRSSILAQEKQNDERNKYEQLIKELVRNTGIGIENKLSSNAQRKRSSLLAAGAISARSTPAAGQRRSLVLGNSVLKRPQLSSTRNLEDDDDDAAISGVLGLKNAAAYSNSKMKDKNMILSTIVIDDDEIEDIISLGNEDRHVLSACAKIREEENSLMKLCRDRKPKKTILPYVEPVNSLQERFSSSPHIKDDWLTIWSQKWAQRKKTRQSEVQETEKVIAKLAANRLAAEAEIQENFRKIQIVNPELLVIDDFEGLIEEPEFVELTPKHRAAINAAICGPPDQILVSKFNLNITRRDIHTLCGQNWLNDEVINFYMNLLTERGDLRHESDGLPTVYAMNTFFVPRLLQAGHDGVKRWTRKVDIFAKDVIPVPVHVGGVHWCMAIIHMKNRTIKYYDSMGTPNPSVLRALEQYLKAESMDKRKQPFDTSGFSIESVQGVPRQMNGSDCGVFSCMFAEYITRDKQITFSQQNMEYFRQKMVLEIVMGELLQ